MSSSFEEPLDFLSACSNSVKHPIAWKHLNRWRSFIIRLPYFSKCSAHTSIVHALILPFLAHYPVNLKPVSQIPSKYSAQAIFHHNFLWKKCALYSTKHGILRLCENSSPDVSNYFLRQKVNQLGTNIAAKHLQGWYQNA
jgi:hypothetical protein